MRTSHLGFTFIELSFVLLIVSALALLCVSQFVLYEKYEAKTTTQTLFSTLQYARSEAIKRNQTVSVCPSSDFEHCHSHWSNGYLVFIGSDKQNIVPQSILRIEKLKAGVTVKSQGLTVIKYSGDGRILTRGTIHINSHDTPPQKIVLYDSGRARIESACPIV
jgi:type IV fimbrial biogenesis protein FimT